MKKLDNKQLEKIVGGDIAVMTYMIVAGIIIFISGIINGYTNPNKCEVLE